MPLAAKLIIQSIYIKGNRLLKRLGGGHEMYLKLKLSWWSSKESFCYFKSVYHYVKVSRKNTPEILGFSEIYLPLRLFVTTKMIRGSLLAFDWWLANKGVSEKTHSGNVFHRL